MIPILAHNEVSELKQKITALKRGFSTNFFLDIQKINLLILNKRFFYREINDTLFFFKDSGDFINLYYITTTTENLKQSLQVLQSENNEITYIIDLVEKKNNIDSLRKVFLDSGFYQYTLLVRMNRMVYNPEFEFQKNKNIKFANQEKGIEVYNLLQNYFDTFAEQLPIIEEIELLVAKKSIFIYLEEDKIVGFIIFELMGITSYLRYWFVHPDYRDKKIGSALLNTFFELSKNTKRQLFWVIESNDNAIKRYEHFGFAKEDLLDCVMINKNKIYEK
jgi:ribosomal protein S18 acetylase RimI-like enzyme